MDQPRTLPFSHPGSLKPSPRALGAASRAPLRTALPGASLSDERAAHASTRTDCEAAPLDAEDDANGNVPPSGSSPRARAGSHSMPKRRLPSLASGSTAPVEEAAERDSAAAAAAAHGVAATGGARRASASIAWVLGFAPRRRSRQSSLLPEGVEQLSTKPTAVPALYNLRSNVAAAQTAQLAPAVAALSAKSPAQGLARESSTLETVASGVHGNAPAAATADGLAQLSPPAAPPAAPLAAPLGAPTAAAAKHEPDPTAREPADDARERERGRCATWRSASDGSEEGSERSHDELVVCTLPRRLPSVATKQVVGGTAPPLPTKLARQASLPPPPAEQLSARANTTPSLGRERASVAAKTPPGLVLTQQPPAGARASCATLTAKPRSAQPPSATAHVHALYEHFSTTDSPAAPVIGPGGLIQSPALSGLRLVDLVEWKKEGFVDDDEFGVIKRQLIRAISWFGWR
ncbi:hypothetical protein KFE25_000196 [Diacronema lutheri]|uniref:Uncharacterized protein n=1 Tax=Diacronema lutheri TaxID=2081491 RepID=A0A8J5XCD9_DIALT|nr:hypothetical protein KFE25_000196 [Diacronema lutheri]